MKFVRALYRTLTPTFTPTIEFQSSNIGSDHTELMKAIETAHEKVVNHDQSLHGAVNFAQLMRGDALQRVDGLPVLAAGRLRGETAIATAAPGSPTAFPNCRSDF